MDTKDGNKQLITVGCLTTFYELNESYSLASVVESQLRSLVSHGYKTVFFVHDNFTDDARVPKGVEIRKVVPRFLLQDYSSNQPAGREVLDQAQQVVAMLQKNAQDIDVMIEHDLLLQGWFLPYAVGIHDFAKTSKMKWLHWVHSNPTPAPAGLQWPHLARYRLPANSRIVYLNNHFLIRAAESFGAWPKDVRIVYNPVDPRMFFGLDPMVTAMIEKYGLLQADFVQVYPVSTPRMIDGKGLYTLIDIFAQLKKQGKKVCLIIANAHANDKREKSVIAQTLSYAVSHGLNQSEIVFTSLESPPTHELGVSRSVISQLFRLSNLFIFPSMAENCSLILLEAMLSKNLLILNDDVPQMRELAGDSALYFKFGSNENTITYTNRDAYMADVAKIIISEFGTNRALRAANKVRQQFNMDYIFKTQIEPLLTEI